MSLFAALDRLKADLDALRPLDPEQEQRMLQKFRLEWNYNSNAIEGNSLTLGETKALLFHGVVATGKVIRDHDDIRNHNKAVAEVESLASDERPITEHLIRELHEILLGKEPYYVPAQTAEGNSTRQLIEPGSYKKIPNHTVTSTGEKLYFSSPEETRAHMNDLVDWYRAEEAAPTMSHIALATEFHHRFVRIHPFDDGNGRMSRLLMNLILLRHGYPITVIKAADRNRYLAALSSADSGDLETFLRFIIENVEAGLRLMIRAAQGESIDEPDDLDKKLALLKKQLATREEFERASWTLDTQKRLYEQLLKFWLEDICNKMQKFDEFFFTSSVRLEMRDGNNRNYGIQQTNSVTAILQSIEEVIAQGTRTIGEIKIDFDWQEFRNVDKPFYQSVDLLWKFEKLKYTNTFSIHPGPALQPSVLEEKYGQVQDIDSIRKFNHQFANKVYEVIIAKVAEADSSPR